MIVNDVVEAVRAEFLDRKIYFTPDDVPANVAVPTGWQNFGVYSGGAPGFPAAWQSFSEELPWVLSLLNIGLIGTAILDGDSLELLYVFHDANGLYYYVGGLPLNECKGQTGSTLPFKGKLSDFYHKVHNGFTFYPAQSMGPQKIEHLTCVADLIDEEDTVFASRWMTVLSNGGGDYLAVDLVSSQGKGVIWWHEQPLEPELDVDVFDVMDTWMSIFLEDTQPRDNIFPSGFGLGA
ncbi:hypothetical protein [Pseudomonas sp. NPDC090201]|jgi:hypothetical protein|uniref:hypothetical protein n=1 Tax=Pseudomonas sp. NPDC090201 TaxID=3364475 RepID=UPI0037F25CBB